MKHAWPILSALLCLAGPALAQSGADAVCTQPQPLDKYQLLKRLSLDLRGKVPSVEEYQYLDAQTTVPDTLVDEYLASDDFRLMMRQLHEQMLWPNISNVRFANTNARLNPTTFGALAVASTGRRTTFRGNPDTTSTSLGEQCGDYEQTHFDPAYPGEYRPDPAYIQKTPEGYLQEGWRMVTPYWAPSTQVKVCAFDAQETLTATVNSVVWSCGRPEAQKDPSCGCGPSLKFCYGNDRTLVDDVITRSLREQLNRQVDEVTVGGKPYTTLLTETTAYQNGPIAFWLKNLAQDYSLSLTYNVAEPAEEIATKDFTDPTWVQVDRKGLHAGVLTLPAYLLRFQTNRGRANRFRIAFECEPFTPPSETESPTPGDPNSCVTTGDDLTQRCTCRYCHSELEPLAAYFGQFTEAGSTLMADTTAFPRESEYCKTHSTSSFCRRFYVSETSTAHRFGWLMPLQFADLHPEIQQHFDLGPRARAQVIIDNGSLAHCTVRHLFKALVKRDIGANDDEVALLETLATAFENHEYDFPWLVKKIVSLPQYRRIR